MKTFSHRLARRVHEQLATVFNRANHDGFISEAETFAFAGYLQGAAHAARIGGAYWLATVLESAATDLANDWMVFPQRVPELHRTLIKMYPNDQNRGEEASQPSSNRSAARALKEGARQRLTH